MDDERFDALTRMLESALSRRRLGPVLTGLGLSGGLALALAGESVAEKRGTRKKKKCKRGKKRCGRKCIDTQSDTRNCGRCDAKCNQGEVCVEGLCRCNQGEVCVEGLCWTPCPEASVCNGAKLCPSGAFCVDVAGSPVCATAGPVSCDQVIDCADTSCPAGTACAVLCCGPDVDEFCMAPG